MSGRARLAAGIGALALALAVVACGDDEVTRYDDGKLIELLNLEKSEGGYAIDGDPFCEVSGRLLNDADEVEQAAEREKLGLVITSAAGNAGVQGIAPFAPDCRDKAKRKLNKLDPKPKKE
ncbi:MAG: hypothetical protein GEU88_04535 [Solirubrobacterales bacterium]|nr:hypothetical protein [Solirubrobacterales bacterium]